MISNSADSSRSSPIPVGGFAPGRDAQHASARLQFYCDLCLASALVQFALAIGLFVALVIPPAWLDRVASQVHSGPEGFALCDGTGVRTAR